jgi:hypothetical protein
MNKLTARIEEVKNEYGHIVKGQTNIKNLWIAREIIVHALNQLTIMCIGLELSQTQKGIDKIRMGLEKGLRKVNIKLGVPVK